ncbi:hypothetical protein N9V94_00705, partial [bacterium]|nr:hypothetical protein [bacterium]
VLRIETISLREQWMPHIISRLAQSSSTAPQRRQRSPPIDLEISYPSDCPIHDEPSCNGIESSLSGDPA